jgi:acetyltransferase EpsM
VRAKGLLDDFVSRDDNPDVIGSTYEYDIQSSDRFILSSGNPNTREELFLRLDRRGAIFTTLVHPLAYVSPSASIGQGCLISPYASVGSSAVLEDHVLLVMYAAVAHDCHIGAFSSFSPFSVANGGSVIGKKVFFGAHAGVAPKGRIGMGSKIAAGAMVYRAVPDRSFAVGNPAKLYPIIEPRSSRKVDLD